MHCIIYLHIQPKIFLEMQFYKWILGCRQPNVCGGNADATFNLLKDNWVLHAFGCRGLQKSLEGPTQFDFQLTHHFRPFAFALAPTTENQLVLRVPVQVNIRGLVEVLSICVAV